MIILVQVLIQQSFAAEITRRYRSDTLDDTRATPCPKMSPSEAVKVYRGSPSTVQPSSLDLSMVATLGIIKRERITTCT
jgi:hypothetical protein